MAFIILFKCEDKSNLKCLCCVGNMGKSSSFKMYSSVRLMKLARFAWLAIKNIRFVETGSNLFAVLKKVCISKIY